MDGKTWNEYKTRIAARDREQLIKVLTERSGQLLHFMLARDPKGFEEALEAYKEANPDLLAAEESFAMFGEGWCLCDLIDAVI